MSLALENGRLRLVTVWNEIHQDDLLADWQLAVRDKCRCLFDALTNEYCRNEFEQIKFARFFVE